MGRMRSQEPGARPHPGSLRATLAHSAAPNRSHLRLGERPGQIPKEGWWDVVVRVKDEAAEDRLSIIAAGVAFYALLAAFPALGALVSIYGLVFDPQQAMD